MDTQNDVQDAEETLDLPVVAGEGEVDETDWKAEAQKLQQKAIRQREKTKELKAKLAEKAEEKAVKTPELKPNDFKFTSGDKALLKSYKDIKGADELALSENWLKKYGGEIEEMLEDDVFNSRLTKLREAKAVSEAIPKSTPRSTGTPNNQVDYWAAKYQAGTPLKDVPQELRAKVLNTRLKTEENKMKFGS